MTSPSRFLLVTNNTLSKNQNNPSRQSSADIQPASEVLPQWYWVARHQPLNNLSYLSSSHEYHRDATSSSFSQSPIPPWFLL